MAMATHQVDLASLPIHQLQAIRQQMDEELQVLTDSFAQLKQAQVKFSSGLESLKPFVEENQNEQVLAPLTNTLYVAGTLADTSKVMVDVGTGYFVEKNIEDAKNFYQRKVDFLKQNLEKLQSTVEQKQSHLRLVMDVIQYKFQALQNESAKKGTTSA